MIKKRAHAKKARKLGLSLLLLVLDILSFFSLLGLTGTLILVKLEDLSSILNSVVLLIVCLLFSVSSIKLEERISHFVYKIKFPPSRPLITNEEWRQIARGIRKKASSPSYIIIIFATIIFIGWFLGMACKILMVNLLGRHHLDFLLLLPSLESQVFAFFVLLLVVLLLISFLPLILAVLSVLWLIRRYLGYPRDEDFIFAECFIIADSLIKDDRITAQKEVNAFVASLTQFLRNWFNPRRTVYTLEFNILRKSKTAISRMLMFGERYVTDLLMSFGLAFVRGDDPTAFVYLNRLISNVRRFGESSGRMERIFGRIERYPRSINLLIFVVILAVALILFILGYSDLASLIKP